MRYAVVEMAKNVGYIKIDHPEKLNALSTQVLKDLRAAVETIAVNEEVQCFIIYGAGDRAFVGGADIAEMHAMTKEEATAYGWSGTELFNRVENLPVPVIAAVNGFCLGGGLELACSCDIRIASETAVFAQPEVGLGISTG